MWSRIRSFLRRNPRVNVVRLSGMIASRSRGAGLSDLSIAPSLEKAFTKGRPDAVALVVNSPGGSPVQSSLIGARIARLAAQKEVPVYAFVEDVAASGGYWLAAAADEIWVDASSVVGSIGVISASFGAHDFIARHGVDRRVYTAGQSKSMLDPFRPENPEDVARLKSVLAQIHTVFIDHVKTSRADRLSSEQDLFTGEVWVGAKAVELGLVDGVGHLVPKMKDVFGDKVRLHVFGPRRGLLSSLGAQVVGQVELSIEERAHYARFGI